ncbi:hypothetical protein CFC21_068072 [Triticum aestivum]|uniref:Large ribosomal subunit protein uL18 C-terminal eukaryotes domain-containing protein n=3 Tax=Triticum TaxID=4564 RepID=A0A9R0TZE2_TRITD|nr:hypothetical protein CFC21_068072 [Triticum aestivum]VAI22967.1 unnamed protein product [Triticum turgidum subsp. durum]
MGADTCSLCTMVRNPLLPGTGGAGARMPRRFRIAMGALDGGLGISHSDKRFVRFKKDKKQLGAEIHRKYIYEGHVADYMKSIADEEPKKYQSHFSEYIKKNIAADDMEALYKKVHAAICAYPTMAKSTKEPSKTHKS